MMDPNEKWVWDDESDTSPVGGRLLEKKLEPLVDWFNLSDSTVVSEAPVELPVKSTDATGTRLSATVEAARPAAEPAPSSGSGQEPADPAAARHATPSSVVKATMLHLDGQVEAAIDELRNGLRQGEPQTELLTALGALQMEVERFEDAAASYREVLRLDPENESAKHNSNLCDEKIRELKKPPKPPQVLVKAIMLHMEGKIDEAIRELQWALRAGEKSLDVQAALGHLQFETGRFDSAAEAYARVIEREPRHKTCHYNLAVCQEKLERHAEALESFRKAFEINPARVEFGIGVGVALLHLRRHSEAAAAFEACLKENPGDFTALFGRAFARQCEGDAAGAEAAYLEALKRNPNHEETLANLIAVTARAPGREAATREHCQKLLELRPESRPALEALLMAELGAGAFEAACAVGERLTRLTVDSFEAWFNYGIACQKTKRGEPAVAAFSKAARLRPRSFEAQASLGAALQQRADLTGARSAYESALRLSPDHPATLWNLAVIAEQSGNGRDAERLFAILATKSPKPEAALFRLGSLRYQSGDYAGSIEAFRSCLKAKEDWPAAQLNLGLALSKSNQHEEARQRLESVNGSFAGDALRLLASMAAAREEYPQALGYYKKLAELGDRTPEVFYNLGLILQNLGRLEEAAQHYREALTTQPDMTEALQALAQVTRGPARVEEIRKGVRKDPGLGPRMAKSR